MIGVDKNYRFFILPHNLLPSHSECFHFFICNFKRQSLVWKSEAFGRDETPLRKRNAPFQLQGVLCTPAMRIHAGMASRGGTTTCLPRKLLPLALLLFGRSRHSTWTARPSKMGLMGRHETLVKFQKNEDLSWRIPELAERLLLLKL